MEELILVRVEIIYFIVIIKEIEDMGIYEGWEGEWG